MGGIFVALLAAALWQTARIEGFKLWPINIPGLKQQLADEKTARANDRRSYESAQREAALRNQAQVQKIEAQHEAVTQAVRSDYARDLERLRAQARANQGAAGGAKVSGVPKAPGGVDGADPLRLPPEVLLRGQELELQLKYLQEWVRRQAQGQVQE
jgi:hypothetical protein